MIVYDDSMKILWYSWTFPGMILNLKMFGSGAPGSFQGQVKNWVQMRQLLPVLFWSTKCWCFHPSQRSVLIVALMGESGVFTFHIACSTASTKGRGVCRNLIVGSIEYVDSRKAKKLCFYLIAAWGANLGRISLSHPERNLMKFVIQARWHSHFDFDAIWINLHDSQTKCESTT